MSRPQVGIERLPATAANRRMSNEPRESMNCKSCRKRKIKCNRLRPTCEACQVFQCSCIYDAVPKKRGPKTDVLEALLKRVDGLERRLKDEKKAHSDHSPGNDSGPSANGDSTNGDVQAPRPIIDTTIPGTLDESAVYSPTPTSAPSPSVLPDVLLDTYFTRVHGKAYHILDETSTRQKLQLNQVPTFLLYSIYAVSARYTAHPNGYHAAVRLSEDYAMRSRAALDIDDPSVDAIQTLLLLSVAFTAAGKGKKAYMMLAAGIGMAMALELHRELDLKVRVTPVEREMRRRLFWTCYLVDRFSACGSKRPSLIADKSIVLRLPSWCPTPAAMPIEGEFFQNGSNLQYHSGSGKKSQGSSGMLIDIVRILGITNRYLAAGGVKGDSHFPWHSLSNLSKIRQDLDIWASGTQDVFSSVDALFGQVDSTTLVLSKLIYHLIHCLIYRPFLPIDLAELAGTGQHQSWQIEATNLCFLHANAIAELVELGKQSSSIEWPAFVGYCICTAGTVHVHGAHYKGSRDGEVFSSSADFLSREMQQLSELRYAWASVQHQRETLQTIYNCHSELVKSLASNPMRYSPVFHLEDFFDRYSTLGQFFDGAHISFADVMVDPTQDNYMGHDLYAPRVTNGNANASEGSSTKRKASSSSRKKSAPKLAHMNGHAENPLVSPSDMITDPISQHMTHPPSLQQQQQAQQQQHQHQQQQQAQQAQQQQAIIGDHNGNTNTGMTPFPHSASAMPTLSQTPFSPPFNFSSLPIPNSQDVGNEVYDPMFGMPQIGNQNMGAHGGYASYDPNSQVMTPGARSSGDSNNSHHGGSGTGGQEEKDPFLSLLEQLAENEHSRGGPSELDFFLSAQGQ